MTVLRKQNKADNFIIFNKDFLHDANLSFGARGLLAYLLCLPDNQEPQPSELGKHLKDGIDEIEAAMKELESAGYIIRSKESTNEGQLSKEIYHIYETPQSPVREEPIVRD